MEDREGNKGGRDEESDKRGNERAKEKRKVSSSYSLHFAMSRGRVRTVGSYARVHPNRSSSHVVQRGPHPSSLV